MVKRLKLMTVIILFPFFNPLDLVRFFQLNKSTHQLLLKHVNFQVLLEAWGLTLTPDQVEAAKISASGALKVVAKNIML